MSNHRYAAVLGRNTALSIAELEALGERPEPLRKDAVLIAGEHHQRLGGTLKVVELLNRTFSNAQAALDALVEAHQADGKLRFGISVYGNDGVGGLLTRVKRQLKERGVSSGFVQSNESLSLAQVKHNQLIRKGVEWCLIETDDGWRAGRTIWIPDFEGFATRDYEKPKNDTKRGMLPPQLARAMVNIATQGTPVAVYDPFCGVGGLLLESLELGHATYGSDIDPKAIEDAKRNIEWLDPEPKWDVTVHDATTPLPVGEPVAIATESYLGELVAPKTDDARAKKSAKEVEAILLRFFETARSTLKPGGRLVITIPAWKLKDEVLRLDIVDRVLALGYAGIRPIPEGLNPPELTDRQSIDVARPKQRVIHELFIFERT